ncbi:zinc finger, C4 type [Dictyocaulus viviparus]|uniref:Zinc finger, C4 type n=1 Tax=Dictyocaulus viviparus TaxID=29172 RepID=A0A0D8X7H4_DICVI|nr:zinc finger, C4 type [Dictyocaulus viviparus]
MTVFSPTIHCQICSDSSDGLHFAVHTCRACAAFFRRTVALNLRYECRHNGMCRIEKSIRNMCRSCRLKKCLEAGMQRSGVQLPRDGIGKRTKNPSKHEPDQRHSIKTKLPKLDIPTASCVELLQCPTTVDMMPLLPTIVNMNPSASVVILPRMLQGYQHFLTIRRTTTTLVGKESRSEEFGAFATNELRTSNFDSSKKVCQLEAHLITDIINTYFYPFDKLQFTQKVILFKNFFCYLSHTDRAYQSYILFGQDECNDRLLMPDGGFIKCSELERFYANAKGVHSQPKEAAKVFRPSMEFILNVIIPYMKRIELTEIEYVAILGFLLWNEAVPDISRDTITIIHLTKDTLLDELHEHYQCIGMNGHEITKRIGKLMLLLPHLTVGSTKSIRLL